MWAKKLGRSYLAILAVTMIVMYICLLAPRPALAYPMQPNILILNSYSRDMKWTENQIEGIMTTFNEAGIEPSFYIEYLDWKRNPSQESLQLLGQLYKSKYSKQPIDIILTTDDIALEFALNYRNEAFSSAPVVYSGVYPESAAKLIRGQRNVTGVQEVMDINGTLELMKRFNPNIRQVYLLYDETESGLAAREPLERAVGNLNPKVLAVSLHRASYQAVIETLRNAPDNSAVLMASYGRDGNGVYKDLERYVELYSEHSRIPIYVIYDFEIGSGAVGGSVLSGHLLGRNAAQLGLRILNGENAAILSPVEIASHVKMLDYRQLQRFRLPLDKVPEEARVINSPQSFYEQYKKIIWTTGAIFCFLTLLIILLMINIRKRQTAEASLKKINEELTATYEEAVASQEELQVQYEQLETIQQDLYISEERYKLSIDGANDGLWDWDISTDEVFFSDRCRSLLDIKGNRLRGLRKILYRRVCAEQLDQVAEKLEAHLAGLTDFFACEYKICTESQEKWVLFRGKALFEGARPVRMAGSLTDITERKDNEQKINYLAYHDQLTGLWNRTALHEKLQLILRRETSIWPGAILFIDVDNFKIVNDTFGHSMGDKLLVILGKMVTEIVQDDGFVVRMGGDEFVIVLYSVSGRAEAACYAKRLANLVSAPLQIEDNKLYVTFSIGLTMFPEDGATGEELLKNADFAMYQAKEKGKNQYAFFNQSMKTVLQEKILLEQNLREAIANNELVLWYQPFVQITTGKIIGFEALLRWNSSEKGILPPSHFIGLAEKTGLIIPIGKKVLLDACQFIASLHNEGYHSLKLTVNISVVQLIEDDFIQSVQQIIAQTGVPPQVLGFEITESVFMEHSKAFTDKLQCIKDMGITILLDDFGSGYSSLKYLNNFPIDVVKIDKSFIDGLSEKEERKQLAEVIIALARQINLMAVAEGVETAEQLNRLAQYQCEIVQGYYFSKPVPPEQVRELLGDADQYQCYLKRWA